MTTFCRCVFYNLLVHGTGIQTLHAFEQCMQSCKDTVPALMFYLSCREDNWLAVWPEAGVLKKLSLAGYSWLRFGLALSGYRGLWVHNRPHCKKRLTIFPFPAGMSLTKLYLDGSLVCDIPAGDGKMANLFLQCGVHSRLTHSWFNRTLWNTWG